MTLIVTMKCKEGVVIAADRQISYDVSSFRTDIEKIERVDFQNFPVMIAIAGSVTNAQRYIDMLRLEAPDHAPKSADEVGGIAQRVMFKLREEVKQCHADDVRALNDVISAEGSSCTLTLGFYFNREPHIVKVDLSNPIYQKSRGQYETEGCGATLADYMLREYFTPGMDFDNTILTAIYTAWIVTQHDHLCRGPITVWIACGPGGLNSDGKPRIIKFSEERINDYIKIIEKVHGKSREARQSVIREQFAIQGREFREMLNRHERLWEQSPLSQEPPDDLGDDRPFSLDPDDPAAR